MSSLKEKIQALLIAGCTVKVSYDKAHGSPYTVVVADDNRVLANSSAQDYEDALDDALETLISDAERKRDEMRMEERKARVRYELFKSVESYSEND